MRFSRHLQCLIPHLLCDCPSYNCAATCVSRCPCCFILSTFFCIIHPMCDRFTKDTRNAYVRMARECLLGADLLAIGGWVSEDPRASNDGIASVVQYGRSVEHLLCTNVHGPVCLVHPGGKLHPNDLFQHKIKRTAKRSRSSLAPVKLGKLIRGCALDKLMAVATYRAEVDRACHDERDVDFDVADSMLEKDPLKWPTVPKTVLALWRTSDGRHHVDEISFPRARL